MTDDEEKIELREWLREERDRLQTDGRLDTRKVLGEIHSAIVYPVEVLLCFHPPELAVPVLKVAWKALGGPRAWRRHERREAEREAAQEAASSSGQ